MERGKTAAMPPGRTLQATHVLELNEVTVKVEGEALALGLKRFDCLILF